MTDWQPAVVPTAKENSDYVAQYAPEYQITTEADSIAWKEQLATGLQQTEFTIGGKIYSAEGLTASAVGTNAGEYVSKVTGTPVVMYDDRDVSEQFIVTTEDGKLTIDKRPVAVDVIGNTEVKAYDGAEQSVTGYTVQVKGSLYKENDFTFDGDAEAEGTNVGVYPMGLKPESFKNVNANFKNIEFNVTNGTLEINPRQVELASGSGSKTYDGQPLENHEITVRGDGFVGEAGVTCHHFASITNKGSVNNTFEYTPKDNTSLENYDITMAPGTLTVDTINQRLQVWAASDRRVYNGEPLTNESYTYIGGILAEGDKLIAEVNGSALHVGDVGVNEEGKVTIYNRDSEDVTANYANITKKKGTLTVTPRRVTIVSASATKTYDGTALTAETVSVSGSGFVDGEGATYDGFVSITDAGQTENTFRYTLTENTLSDNYTIAVVNGLLFVNKHTGAKLEAKGYKGIYDGMAHDGVSDKQVVAGVDSDEWKYTYSTDGETFVPKMPQFKDVGAYTVYVKATNDNYEGNALITTVPVEITPVAFMVTADSHTIATGDADPKLSYQADTPVAAETPAFRGELVRDPGNTKGVYAIKQGTLALTDGEGFKAANYTLVYVPGELTILQRTLDITKTVNKTKVYVGDELVYTIIVTNTCDVDLENVLLVDEMLHVQENIGELGVGKSVTRQYTYVVTEEDEGKQLVNTAVATADGGTANEGHSEATLVKPKAP